MPSVDPDQTQCSVASDLITKSCLYNFDPLKSHFHIVKLGFTGVYIIYIRVFFFLKTYFLEVKCSIYLNRCVLVMWIYTVCLCPFYGTPGLNGLMLMC